MSPTKEEIARFIVGLPWNEEIVRLSVHPSAATIEDVQRLASELMEARAAFFELRSALARIEHDGNPPANGIALDALEASDALAVVYGQPAAPPIIDPNALPALIEAAERAAVTASGHTCEGTMVCGGCQEDDRIRKNLRAGLARVRGGAA